MCAIILGLKKENNCDYDKYEKLCISFTPQLQPRWMTRLSVVTSAHTTQCPGRCLSTSATTSAAAPSSMTSGSCLLPTVGKSLCYINVFGMFKTMIFYIMIKKNVFASISAPTHRLPSWVTTTSICTRAPSSTCQWMPSTGIRVTTTRPWTTTLC